MLRRSKRPRATADELAAIPSASPAVHSLRGAKGRPGISRPTERAKKLPGTSHRVFRTGSSLRDSVLHVVDVRCIGGRPCCRGHCRRGQQHSLDAFMERTHPFCPAGRPARRGRARRPLDRIDAPPGHHGFCYLTSGVWGRPTDRRKHRNAFGNRFRSNSRSARRAQERSVEVNASRESPAKCLSDAFACLGKQIGNPSQNPRILVLTDPR
jgi:hypothetical protein